MGREAVGPPRMSLRPPLTRASPPRAPTAQQPRKTTTRTLITALDVWSISFGALGSSHNLFLYD